MTRRLQTAVLCVIFWTVPGTGQPLYIGDQEVDTADRGALAALIRRCEALEATAATMSADEDAGSPPDPSSENLGPEPPAQNVFGSTIKLDDLASSGDGAEAAGEGAGSGAQTGGEEGGDEGGTLELSAVTVDACKEAGIVY